MDLRSAKRKNGGNEDSAFPFKLRFFACTLAFPLFLSTFLPLSASAQTSDVVELLVQRRTEARIAELLREFGDRVVPRPYVRMYEPTLYWLWMEQNFARRQAIVDSLIALDELEAAQANALDAFPVGWRKIATEEQGKFLDRFREVFWRSIATPFPQDTVATPQFRAHLSGLFGAPTRSAAAMEHEQSAGSEYVQFEYWLIANDSIPVLVLDIDGPFGLGVLVAADEAYADDFAALKDDLIGRVFESEPAPYADYYHSLDRQQWYRTGFDGKEYFILETQRPQWITGRSGDDKWRIFR